MRCQRKVPVKPKRKVIPSHSRSNRTVLTAIRTAQAKAAKDNAKKADDPKAGADIGKIVNLMSSDTNRVRYLVK